MTGTAGKVREREGENAAGLLDGERVVGRAHRDERRWRQLRLLGLSCGQQDGSAEILLKAALKSAENEGVEVRHVRLNDLRLPVGPARPDEVDDAEWFLDQYLDADALIASAPIHTRALPGALKLLLDRVLGPKADVVLAEDALHRGDSSTASGLGFEVSTDRRVLNPRVAGLIAVGGCREARWRTLALPLLHTLTFSTQVKVVDQIDVRTPGGLGGIATDAAAVERAERLGETVAEQAGLPYDQASYRGGEGVCPVCHLNLLALRDAHVECGTCGARGEFVVDDGRVRVAFSPAGQERSIFAISEKRAHHAELRSSAASEPSASDIDRCAAAFREYDRIVLPDRWSPQ